MKILETERLILREIDERDDAFMLDLLNQPSFIKYIGDRNVRDLEQSREFIEMRYRKSYTDNGYGLWAVELKGSGQWSVVGDQTKNEGQRTKDEGQNQVIGICGFVKRDSLPDADIGFAFLPQFEKKGYALESARAVMDYGRETLGLKRVLAITTQNNDASGRLLEKLGFKYEGLITQPHDTQELKLFSKE